MKLSEQKINAELKNHFPGNVTVKSVVTSTQKLAKEACSKVPQAFLAEHQTGGYGKQARAFYSPSETGLYLSVLLPDVDPDEMEKAGLFTTGLADAIAILLEHYYPEKQLGVKWVNDVLLGPAKVCGILVEAAVQGQQINWIVGVVINLSTTEFHTNIDRVVGSLDSEARIDRNQLAADVIKTIWQLKNTYQAGEFLKDYQQRLILMNKRVTLKLADRERTGIVRGIDQQGRLVVKLADGLHAFNDGEVIKVQY